MVESSDSDLKYNILHRETQRIMKWTSLHYSVFITKTQAKVKVKSNDIIVEVKYTNSTNVNKIVFFNGYRFPVPGSGVGFYGTN